MGRAIVLDVLDPFCVVFPRFQFAVCEPAVFVISGKTKQYCGRKVIRARFGLVTKMMKFSRKNRCFGRARNPCLEQRNARKRPPRSLKNNRPPRFVVWFFFAISSSLCSAYMSEVPLQCCCFGMVSLSARVQSCVASLFVVVVCHSQFHIGLCIVMVDPGCSFFFIW